MKLGGNFAVFLAFFALAMFEAIQKHNWLNAVLWLAVGAIFLYTTNRRSSKQH